MAVEGHLKVLPTVVEAGRGTIAREITIGAPPEVVFSFFTDPAKHVAWQGKAVQIDPRPGGLMRIEFGPGYVAVGRYLEVDPPRRLVYTWGWEEAGSSVLPPGSSTVEVVLEARGEGTVLRLRHSVLPEDTLVFHGQGWDETLPAMAAAAGGTAPIPKSD